MMPMDRIKIAYSDRTPKRLALLVALVPVKPNQYRIRYGCDRMNDVTEESLGSAHQASLEYGKTTLIGGADVTDRGGFHTDSTRIPHGFHTKRRVKSR